MLPGGGLSVLVALVLLVLAAAKAHGRQVRLARERFGIRDVDFRRDNGPIVEGIWRRDRALFWTGAGSAAAFLIPSAALGLAFTRWPVAGAVGIAAVLAFVAGFVFAGGVEFVRHTVRHGPADPPTLPLDRQASLGWWALVAMAGALVWVAVR